MSDSYEELMENAKIPAVSNMQEHVTEACATNMHSLITTKLHTEQTCNKLSSQLCCCNKGNFKSVIMSANIILQKQQYIHGFMSP